MRHLLMDPAFPDIVGEWAAAEALAAAGLTGANDNGEEVDALSELSDPLLTLAARMEVEATRLW